LIELMIALASVAILSSVAYPSYRQYVQRTERAQARVVLLEARQFMERFYAANGTYAGAVLPRELTTAPAGLIQQGASAADPDAPVDRSRYVIRIAAESATANGYRLSAKPVMDDECGDLGLDQAGRQTAAGASVPGASVTVQACWR
jgi:type IV pilus assembly protein PilE